MNVSWETSEHGLTLTLQAESPEEEAMLGLLIRRGPPTVFECDPYGDPSSISREARMFWPKRETT